ncbi:MAG: ribose-5-phosphate isomerase RpiA [Deltaproteobacteria bacterium]|nr:MAG: ribose-5-phosphate isomerase RpiA [Deltaproteobacteria bacterium]
MTDDIKRKAAVAALAELPDAGIIGIGTGSTARLFIAALGELVAAGRRYTCVPTSEASRVQARELGIPLLPDDGPWDIAVTVDGADEVDGALHLIKGGGGAHTREKIVNFSSRRNVIIVDASKLSPRLGERWPVPVEVLPFAHLATRSHLAGLGVPVMRIRDGSPARSDAGNLIYDVACGPIADPGALDTALRAIPGVVETGLFVGRADVVLVAHADRVERRVR